jgi:cell shape-determining protein MreC
VGLSRSGTLFLIGLLVLIALSLHPMASVETSLAWAFSPARLLSELARPFAWLSRSEVAAAEGGALAAFPSERERSHALLFAAQAGAMPVDPSLTTGRAAVACQVIGRFQKNRDRLRLRYALDSGVTAGSPIVNGDVFVGRVIELDPGKPGECLAELVTAKDFRVSCVVEGSNPIARFVVGGVLGKARKEAAGLHLAVQYPSDRAVVTGLVRVLEEVGSREARLADGFLLGALGSVDVDGTQLFGISAPLDFEFGLAHLAILVPPERGTAGPVLPIDPFEASSWIDARVILAGDPTPMRDTRRLALTTSSGVGPGAALAIGARFVGRLERVGPLDSDARLLADPGLAFSALARIEGVATPIPLGRLIARGRDGERIVFECSREFSKDERRDAPIPVELWTAAADPDLPPGLLVGAAELDLSTTPCTLRVQPAADAGSLQHVRVWRGRAQPLEGDS